MTAQMTDKAKEAVKTQIPLGRAGKVEDIAEGSNISGIRKSILHHRTGDFRGRRYEHISSKNILTAWVLCRIKKEKPEFGA